MNYAQAAEARGWWKHVVCRISGHQFYWLDSDHQCHCIRCGKPDADYFRRQEFIANIWGKWGER